MKNFRIYGVSALLGATLAMGLASCSSSDPATDPVVVAPKVEVSHSISGLVVAMDGTGINGATVTLGDQTATTAQDGSFSFASVKTGSYTVKASATGKVANEAAVTVDEKDNMNPVCNITLTNEPTKIAVKSDGSAEGNTETETLKDNDAAKIEVVVEAPAEAIEVPAGEEAPEIIITPTYTEEQAAASVETKSRAAITRADDSNGLYLTGSTLACSSPNAKLKKPISLTFKVDASMLKLGVHAKKYKDGKWVSVNTGTNFNTNIIKFDADEFAPYALFLTSATTSSANSTENLTFTKNLWDNTSGSSEVKVDNAEYSFKLGTDLKVSTNPVEAYLIEILARIAGVGSKTATGSYPLNVTLPVGTALSIAGTQAVTTYTAKIGDKSVSAKQYGNVAITTKTWAVSREHTGGGSK